MIRKSKNSIVAKYLKNKNIIYIKINLLLSHLHYKKKLKKNLNENI